jgi:DNA-binding transcriptional LysR family regulator
MHAVIEMTVFAHVVEAGSFSAAARKLGASKSSVSAQVQRLERSLGVRLLDRTTRRVSTTEAGAAVYRHCARIVAETEAAAQLASGLHATPRGLLRVTAPDTLGWMHVAPAIPAFLSRFPEVEVELSLSDAHVDLVRDRFDLAIRVGRVAQSSLVVRRLGVSRLVICAAPAYLRSSGEPKVARDLGRHACLVFTSLGWGSDWRLGPAGRQVRVAVRARLRSDSGEVLLQAARAGAGLALLPDWMVAADLRDGALLRVLPRLATPAADIHAVYPPGRLRAAKATAFVDHLAASLGRALAGP